MKIIDKYILKKFLGTFIYSIALILLIFIVFDLKDKLPGFLEDKTPLKEIILDYYLMFIPVYGNMFSPLFTFISVIFFTSRMAHRNEFVAMLSSGIPYNRILRPYLITAVIIAVTSLVLNHIIIPKANRKKIAFEDKWFNNAYNIEDKNIHRMVGDGEVLYLYSFDNRAKMGYKVSLEKIKNHQQVYYLKAEAMQWDSTDKSWLLNNVMERRLVVHTHQDSVVYKEEVKVYPNKKITIDFTPDDLWRYESKLEIMNYWELKNYIKKERQKGGSKIEYFEVEHYRRTAFPFATFVLTIIGVSVSSRKVRGGVGWTIALGLFLSALYIMLMYIFTILATTGFANTLLAVWIPNIVFSLVAYWFYTKAQK
ncbi:MAG: LptF/LptG family permease [Bacteroidia bacterium]|nr:LptF/LptG family permease [Bacteroidia bacterium]